MTNVPHEFLLGCISFSVLQRVVTMLRENPKKKDGCTKEDFRAMYSEDHDWSDAEWDSIFAICEEAGITFDSSTDEESTISEPPFNSFKRVNKEIENLPSGVKKNLTLMAARTSIHNHLQKYSPLRTRAYTKRLFSGDVARWSFGRTVHEAELTLSTSEVVLFKNPKGSMFSPNEFFLTARGESIEECAQKLLEQEAQQEKRFSNTKVLRVTTRYPRVKKIEGGWTATVALSIVAINWAKPLGVTA